MFSVLSFFGADTIPEAHMNSVGPSLLDFSRAAAQAADTSRIKVSGQNVGSTKLPTWASTNHAAMTAFVEAMRRELGSVIADATATRLHAILGDDRPLTARLVRESIDEAVRMAQSGLNGRDRFLSDIDPRHGFSAAFDQAVAPLRGKLDDEGLALLRDAMKQEINPRFPPGADGAGDPAALAGFMSRRSSVSHFCSRMLELPMAGQVGARAGDLVSLALRMGVNTEYGGCLCQALPSLRDLQPQGELKPETIWQGLFGESLPEGMPTQGTTFSDALVRRLDAHLESLVPGKGAVVRAQGAQNPLERAREIVVTGRPVTMNDLSAPGLSLRMGLSAGYSGEQLLARDMGRRMGTTLAGTDSAVISTPPRIEVGGRTFVVGRETPFSFASEADKTSYRQGRPSTLSSGIMGAFREICGGGSAEPRQVEMLGALASQAPMRSLLGTGGVGIFKGVVNTPLTEHSSTTVSVSMGDDGVAHVRISTSEEPDAVCFSGFASVSYDVAPDGTATPTDVVVAPVFGDAAQAIVTQAGENEIPTAELRNNVAEALRAGTISRWEADRLEARLADRIVGPEDLGEAARNMRELRAELSSREFAAYVNSEREMGTISAAEAGFLLSELPRIASQGDLVDFLRGLPGAPVHGAVEHAGTATDFAGRESSLYTFRGLVFRGDSRAPDAIRDAGGFKSKNDLSRPEDLREAQGLGQAIGATGTAGVSCARELGRCLPYCDYGSPYGRGFVYIIDTARLGEGRQAYDMAAISVRNGYKRQDESGGEVNVTDIPHSAVVGWLEIPDADNLRKGDPDGGVAALMDTLEPRYVHFNPQYHA